MKFTNRTVEKFFLCILASTLLRVSDLFAFQELTSCQFPIQRVWIGFHFLLDLLDVLREYRLCRSEILDSTFFCVRTLRHVSLHFLGSEMNLTLSFLSRSDKLVVGLHLLLSCKYSGEANVFRICSSPTSDSGGGGAMLSAESVVDVVLGLWKNIGVTSVLFISVRSLGSQPVGTFDSATWPNVAPCRGSSQWSSPSQGNSKEVGFGVRVECAEEVQQMNNNDCA